jgi:hypothetical protein
MTSDLLLVFANIQFSSHVTRIEGCGVGLEISDKAQIEPTKGAKISRGT